MPAPPPARPRRAIPRPSGRWTRRRRCDSATRVPEITDGCRGSAQATLNPAFARVTLGGSDVPRTPADCGCRARDTSRGCGAVRQLWNQIVTRTLRVLASCALALLVIGCATRPEDPAARVGY